jgi:F-type H+-transporting ATPase subunit a
MDASPLASTVLFRIGPVPITRPVATTWAIMLGLTLISWLVTRRLYARPDRRQAVLEVIVTGILRQISGVLPGTQAPTAKIETPAALALIVFVSVHYYGIRAQGPFSYLASFARPKLIMLPLNLLSEVTRTFSLMVRLFGNIMSGEFVIALVAALAGLFIPIPFMALEILLGLVQAYIFTVLATVFIGAAIGSVERG